MHFSFLRWFSQDTWVLGHQRMLRCSQTVVSSTELRVQQKSQGHLNKGSSPYLRLSSLSNSDLVAPSKTWSSQISPGTARPLHNPRAGLWWVHFWWRVHGEGVCEWGAHGSYHGTRWCMWQSGHDNYNNCMSGFLFVLKLHTITSETDALPNLLWTSNCIKWEAPFN